jgi:sensor histidine kinase YesM
MISIETDGEGTLTVKNNLQRKATHAASTKIGLKNIIERYKLLDCGVVTVEDDGQFFSVTLPLLKPDAVRHDAQKIN